MCVRLLLLTQQRPHVLYTVLLVEREENLDSSSVPEENPGKA